MKAQYERRTSMGVAGPYVQLEDCPDLAAELGEVLAETSDLAWLGALIGAGECPRCLRGVAGPGTADLAEAIGELQVACGEADRARENASHYDAEPADRAAVERLNEWLEREARSEAWVEWAGSIRRTLTEQGA